MGEHIETDLLVIGGGSGGLSVAAGASQMGARVVLLEKGEMGGDCLNVGCVPSKALIAAAKHAHAMQAGAPFGIATADPAPNYAAAMAHVQAVIAGIAPIDSQQRFEGLGVHVIREPGHFISHDTVDTASHRIAARRVVIATGSTPFVPPIEGIDTVDVLTNESLWDLRNLPKRLIIIGGGPIGMEMAQAHRRLGAEVTVIEGARALGKDDPEMAKVVLKRLRAEGIEIVEEAAATRVEKTKDGVRVETGKGTFDGSHLLLAVGRKASVEGLGLEKAGITYDRRGIQVSKSLRTTNRRVYAIGDCIAGGLQFTHVAGYHAGIVIRQALLSLPATARTDHIPWATYTDPELAQVGLTEAEARKKHGIKLEVYRFPYAENDRAAAELKTEGLIKIMVVGGRPVGASIAGAQAGELIHLWALAIANKLKLQAIAGMVAPYPTMGEINKRAAGQYFAPKLFESEKVKRLVRFVQRF